MTEISDYKILLENYKMLYSKYLYAIDFIEYLANERIYISAEPLYSNSDIIDTKFHLKKEERPHYDKYDEYAKDKTHLVLMSSYKVSNNDPVANGLQDKIFSDHLRSLI
jgi:hypothetical protein